MTRWLKPENRAHPVHPLTVPVAADVTALLKDYELTRMHSQEHQKSLWQVAALAATTGGGALAFIANQTAQNTASQAASASSALAVVGLSALPFALAFLYSYAAYHLMTIIYLGYRL